MVSCSNVMDEPYGEKAISSLVDQLDGKAFILDSARLVSFEYNINPLSIMGGGAAVEGLSYLSEHQLYFNDGKILIEPPCLQFHNTLSRRNKEVYETLIQYYLYHQLYWWTEIGSYEIDALTNELYVHINMKINDKFPENTDNVLWGDPTLPLQDKISVTKLSNGQLELFQIKVINDGLCTNTGVWRVFMHEIKDYSSFVYLNSQQEVEDYVTPYLEKAKAEEIDLSDYWQNLTNIIEWIEKLGNK